jgi:hypothetical protein
MLRCVLDGVELDYVPVAGATRRGTRPAKLEPIKGILRTASTPATPDSNDAD